MYQKPLRIYELVVNSGVDASGSIEQAYKIRSLNKFCFFTILIAIVYGFVFSSLEIWGPFGVVTFDYIGFSGVIFLNHKRLYTASKFLLICTSAMSVLVISLMLGFETGFHLYLYTSPLFIFWLFDSKEKGNIIISFLIYLIVYGAVFLFRHGQHQLYDIKINVWSLDLYSLNMIFNLILVFLLFYNYTSYYKILMNNLLQKQGQLQEEIEKRKESEYNTKKLFDDLSLSYKNLEQFGFVVSHNMRAPLANIKGFVGLYDKSGKDLEGNAKIADYVQEAANHLDNILSDLNHILKNKSASLEDKEEIIVENFVESIIRSLYTEILSSGTVIEKQYGKHDKIYTIKSTLTSIVYNLIQNAIKYRKNWESPRIGIHFSSFGGYYIIKISDNGIGIDLKKYHDRVFRLYSRFHLNADGKGIGLYLVKTQVELLGGVIEVESEVNKGSVFTVKLPLNR